MNTQIKKENSFSLTPSNLQEAIQFAEILAKSTIVPKHYQNKSGDILVAVQMGAELGLKPIQALQNIAVINGKPSVYGDALLALVQINPVFENIEESFDEETNTAYCTVKRKGESEYKVSFSEKDARKAGLWGKGGPWTTYPKRMLQMRARGFALRDKFADVLGGLITAEEARDYPTEDNAIKTVSEESRSEETTTSPALDKFLDNENKDTGETLIIDNSRVDELQELIAVSNIPDETIERLRNKWCHAGNVEKLEELPEDKLIACIEYVRTKGMQASVEA
jgi:hypothetical protein